MKNSRGEVFKYGAGVGIGALLGASAAQPASASTQGTMRRECACADWASEMPPVLREPVLTFASLLEEITSQPSEADAFLRDPQAWLNARGLADRRLELGEYEIRFFRVMALPQVRAALRSGDLQAAAEELAKAHLVPLDVPSSLADLASASLTDEQKHVLASGLAEVLGKPEELPFGPTFLAFVVVAAVVWSVVTVYSQAAAVVFLVWRYAAKYDSQLAPSEVPEWAAVVRLLHEMGHGERAAELAVRLCASYARQLKDLALRLAPELAAKERAIMRMAAGLFLRLLTGLPPSDQMVAAALGAANA